MAQIYSDGSYLQHNPGWHEEDSPWKAQQILAMLQRHGLQPRRVCEIGCGAGEVLRQLSLALPSATECVGYDISPQAHALAGAKANARLRFECADLLTSDDAGFDLALAVDVIEHVEDVFGFLRRLRPKATHTVLHIPLDLSVQTLLRVRPILDARRQVGHLHYFTRETALALLADCGYEVQSWAYTRWAWELPNRHRSAALLKWPRRLAYAVSPDWGVRLLGGCSLLVLAR